MKNILTVFLVIGTIAAISGCTKDQYGNYPGGVPYDVVSILDIRPLYKGQDVTLTMENMYGGKRVQAVVVSEHAAGNLPQGLLIVQDKRRQTALRGISIDLGAAAANYHQGDSVEINVEGGTLTRQNGVLTLKGITEAKITRKGTGHLEINSVNAGQLATKIDQYESTLCMVTKVSFNPVPQPGDVISGAKTINDGFGNFTLYTDPGVSYANSAPIGMAAYIGIPFRTTDDTSFQFRTRKEEDIISMGNASLAQDLVITGWQGDPEGGDGDYEYVQLLATKDIDFSVTPYSIVFANSAGTSTPSVLDSGWATGDRRTIKWDITSGSVQKGKFFYFGGTKKMINGSKSTLLSDANWYAKKYATSGTNPGDGGLARVSNFGTSGPFANSGNASAVAIFKGTSVTEKSVPVDLFFIGSGGNNTVYDAEKGQGFRICNNDWYAMVSIDPATLQPLSQPFFKAGSNTLFVGYHSPSDKGFYYMMGGVYNLTLGRWTKARADHLVDLTKESTLAEIESGLGGPNDEFITKLEE
ncbi:DUF5689 domain-containing protein [Niabella aurantiaca]|uniref:DUF5689 domain-containing protein n=1 Tax=Niabella aurantiaca TaxID=379900 RepID=UPI00036B13B2|nr:DUF5689 domain-containing protein [Niabella aurantiaca]